MQIIVSFQGTSERCSWVKARQCMVSCPVRCIFTTCDKVCDTESISLKCLKRINNMNITRNLFFMASDDSQGGIKICLCLSVRLFVRRAFITLYGIEFVYSRLPQFSRDLFKTLYIFDIMQMCLWSFDGNTIIFDRVTAL